MKKLIAICTLSCATGLAFAADPAPTTIPMNGKHMMDGPAMMAGAHHGQRMSADERANMLKQRLQLNDEQTAKVKKIFEAKEKDAQALRDKYKPQLDAYYADKKKLHDKTHSDIDAVLTPAQKEQFKQMPMGGRMCDGHGKGGMMNHGGMGDMHKGMMHDGQAPAPAAKKPATKT